MTEICSELGYGVVNGVGGHTRCLRDGICPELQGGDIPSESEKVVEKGVPLQVPICFIILYSPNLVIKIRLHNRADFYNSNSCKITLI